MTAVGYVDGDDRKLNRSGGTLTGPLILDAAPVEPLGAATKGYVDTAVTAAPDATPDATTSVKGKAVLLGGTAAAPTVPYAAVTGKPVLAAVATSGSASDLTGGTLPDSVIPAGIARDVDVAAAIAAIDTGGSVPDATTSVKGRAVLLGGTAAAPTVPYTSVTGKPALAAVATSGSASDLTGTLPDGVIPSGIARDSEVTAAVAGLAPLASPAFTGTPTGITKTHVGLGSADNTADVTKPVSTAQQAALDLKAAKASLRPTVAVARLPVATNVTPISLTGLPGAHWLGQGTQFVGATTVQYAPFAVEASITVETMTVECTTAPATPATVHVGVYRADSLHQPYGAPLIDAALAISATGVFTTSAIEIVLAPGTYVTAIISDVSTGCRTMLAAYPGLKPALGTTPYPAAFSAPATAGALTSTPRAWDTLTYATTPGVRHLVTMAWRDAAVATLVTDGDSLTAGVSGSAGRAYPKQLWDLLADKPILHNHGVSGQGVTAMAADAATQLDILEPTAPLRVLVAWAGTNDLGIAATAVTTVESNYQSYCAARRAAGFKVVACTLLPRGDASLTITAAQFETARTTFNTWLRANYTTFADALADIGANATIGAAGAYTNTTYYSADLVHLNDTGYGVVAGVVRPALAGLGII